MLNDYCRVSGIVSNCFDAEIIFTTRDNDNDNGGDCAQWRRSAWWFNSCMQSLLNAPYSHNPVVSRQWHGIIWYDWKGSCYSLKFTEMKTCRNN